MSPCTGWQPILALVILSLCAIQFENVEADYVLQVQLHSYNNTDEGSCCERLNQESCTTPCDRLCLCIREANSTHDDTNCTLFEARSLSTDPRGLNFRVNGPWTGAVQVLIMVFDGATEELIDNIFIEIALDVKEPLTPTQTYTGVNGVAIVQMGFDADCAPLFVGSNCTTCAEGSNGPHCICMDRNDDTGHYTCNADGSITCRTGYQNETTDCTMCAPADGCSPAGGYCDKPGECLCHPGYEGETCSNKGPSDHNGEAVTTSPSDSDGETFTNSPTAPADETATTPELDAAKPAKDNDDDDDDDIMPIIVGVVVGVIVLMVFVGIVVVAVLVYRRRNRGTRIRNKYTNFKSKSDSPSDETYAVVRRDSDGKKRTFTYRTFELDGGESDKSGTKVQQWFDEPSPKSDATIVANPAAESRYAEIPEVRKEMTQNEPSTDATILVNPAAEALYAEISEVQKEMTNEVEEVYADVQHERTSSESVPYEDDRMIYSEVQVDRDDEVIPDDDDDSDDASTCSDQSAQL